MASRSLCGQRWVFQKVTGSWLLHQWINPLMRSHVLLGCNENLGGEKHSWRGCRDVTLALYLVSGPFFLWLYLCSLFRNIRRWAASFCYTPVPWCFLLTTGLKTQSKATTHGCPLCFHKQLLEVYITCTSSFQIWTSISVLIHVNILPMVTNSSPFMTYDHYSTYSVKVGFFFFFESRYRPAFSAC